MNRNDDFVGPIDERRTTIPIRANKPLRIGFWCDYRTTLLPQAGIGVFVYNLIDGLLAADPNLTLTLQISRGQERRVAAHLARWGARVRIWPPPWPRHAWLKRWAAAILWKFVRLSEIVWHGSARLETALHDHALLPARDFLKRTFRLEYDAFRTRRQDGIARWARAACVALAAVAAALVAWILLFVYHLITGFLLPTIRFPARLTFVAWQELFGDGSHRAVEYSSLPDPECDVWLIPHANTFVPFNAPEVLVIFDLVYRHVPDVFPREQREGIDRQIKERARQATRIYCGSSYVHRVDLAETIPFAVDRVRVFPLAPARDLSDCNNRMSRDELTRRYQFGKRFLFYPAAIRAHKNHAVLIQAVKHLRDDLRLDIELVCTGEARPSRELRRLVRSIGMADAVHFLGLVPRADVHALYQHAAAVVLPSLHEGYGLPVAEAMQAGALLVCSDIPAFRELLVGHHDAVPFFDPRDPRAMADAIARAIADRDRLIARQREAIRAISQRDWKDVAQDFLNLFHEAIEAYPQRAAA